MVARQLRPNGITDERVLEAMGEVPREEFLTGRLRRRAYDDRALPIPAGQTISQPLVVAAMTQALALRPGDRALEVGTGTGYQAAVLSRLCGRVTSVELEPELARLAAANLERLGYRNVAVVTGDGSLGWPAAAPYDAILVACAAPEVPPALVEQLAPAGRLVMPVGPRDEQTLVLLTKGPEGRLAERTLFGVRFVPMR